MHLVEQPALFVDMVRLVADIILTEMRIVASTACMLEEPKEKMKNHLNMILYFQVT
jgi:hypothetical protein